MQHVASELELHRRREHALAGRGDGGVRGDVAASWRRVAAGGLDPGSRPEIPPLPTDDLERRRAESGLAAHVEPLTHTPASVLEAGQMMVLADAHGRVLWRAGSSAVRRRADALGFIHGSDWTEANVGTNAIGTALVDGSPVHIRGAEHFCESHLVWGCVAAPLTDPWTGDRVGVLDVSGPASGIHPAELDLVQAAGRLVQLEWAAARRARLDRLRARTGPLLARLRGDVLAVDTAGHVAAAIGAYSPDRVALPGDLHPGEVWLPRWGRAIAEPVEDGWMLRLDADPADAAQSLEIDLGVTPSLRVEGAAGTWTKTLSPRHAEILVSLHLAGPDGRTAQQLSHDLFDDPDRVVTVRAEMSRLRKVLGGVIASAPYRFAGGITHTLRMPSADPLPASSAPVIRALRIAAAQRPE